MERRNGGSRAPRPSSYAVGTENSCRRPVWRSLCPGGAQGAGAPCWVIACVVSCMWTSAPARSQAEPVSGRDAVVRPNILWLSSEDNGPHLGAYGDEVATTPRLDALAQRGMLYERAWSNAPVCAPARTAIISGLLSDFDRLGAHEEPGQTCRRALRSFRSF